MDTVQLFFSRYVGQRSAIEDCLSPPEARWRARPHGFDLTTRVVWQMARAEDSGVSRPVCAGPQVLDDPAARWPERRRLPHRHHGSIVPSAAVDAPCD